MTRSSLRMGLMAVTVVAAVSLGEAVQVAPPRLIGAGATHLQVTWDGQGQNYQVVATAADGSESQRSPIVNRGPVTLVNLRPAAKYLVRVQAVAFTVQPTTQPAASAALRVVGESRPLEVATEPWQGREWSHLRLWPSRHVDSFPAGTTHPALAADDGELLLVELHQRALYVSRVTADSLQVIAKQQLCELPGEQVAKQVDAAVIKKVLWVTWISQARGTEDAINGVQMLVSYDLQTSATSPPTELHPALKCGLTTFNGRLWLLWQAPGSLDTVQLARYDPSIGLQEPWEWSVERATWAAAAAEDLGADLFLAGVKSAVPVQSPAVGPITDRAIPLPPLAPRPLSSGIYQLWAAKFNGRRFYESRMLRGGGDYSALSTAALNSSIVVVYAHQPRAAEGIPEGSDIDITLTTGSAGRVASNSYIHDGTYNITPDAARVGDAIFVAYNKWSGSPQKSSTSINYGTFIGKIELKF